MITINMKMPDSCIACPFVAPGQKGRMKCSVMEYIGTRTIEACTVKAGGRAPWCPLCEIREAHDVDHER